MHVGIYTHYAHCDQAYLAIRLAQLFRKIDIDFDIYSDNYPGKLCLPYDNAVVTKDVLKFTEWAKKQRVIIWTQIPRVEQLNFAKRKGIKTILAPMWQELMPPFRRAIRSADHVVSMSTECQTLFEDIYKVKSHHLIPYDTGLPIVRKDRGVNPRKIKILLPWFDRNARCSGGQFIAILKFIISRMEEAHLTVAITPSHFSPSIVKFFNNLSKSCDGRVSVVRGTPVHKRPDLYAAHDITLNPAECDNYGLCSLMSITMGTPVIASAVPPQTDFLYPDNNAVLVKTKLDYDENGVVHALPDYEHFGYVLQELIAEPQYIHRMNQKTSYNLNTRRHQFETGWTNILEM